MINAADLPAVRARTEAIDLAENGLTLTDADVVGASTDAAPPCYPSKKLVLENGRYVVAGTTK
jgi:hypothetical protein